MIIPTYALNTLIRFTATTYNVSGALADPTTVLFFAEDSTGLVSQYNPVRDTKGQYHYDFLTATPSGRWNWWYQGLGSLQIQSLKSPFNVQF